ncbi:histidine decarboxylase [Nostoc sp. FACHB-87]|uniref:histidine decarboxylase n=1 Tax=Nostocales TaxID=1161 RepID=UPI001684950B|nr:MULTISPECIES: histidine decarboxylase [Nostocales]MBD2299563.1 histidine decarboxylase [Nostoc sp. FACHB-190]MBD2455324.1 histidine decarboxylase [Nostoc sp. FACHB-87]MBD2476850.1 histidine decarboxylase [Anabaena sp. FACHB-83]MBD2489243.1 histidine decarboxylase [Aulosira sp. FACHB-615]
MLDTVSKELALFWQQIEQKTQFHAGYPYNLSCDFTYLTKFFNFLLNNAGDPYVEPDFGLHSRKFEQEVLSFFSQLYKIPENESWGYVTAGGTEGNLYGMLLAREIYPDGILYSSQDSHYSIAKAARLFGIKHQVINSQTNGEINYQHLSQAIQQNSQRPVILNLNIGTTVKGAIDNLDKVLEILKQHQIKDYYIHCDAALSGMILPFLENAPQINFQRPIDSIAISGKFIGSPLPCGVVLTKKKWVEKVETMIEYLGSKDTTILGSRNGHTPLIIWYALKTRGYEGFAKEAKTCIQNAQYLFQQLKLREYPCMLNKFSNTVVFQKPSQPLIKKWQLATMDNVAHLIVMQNIDRHKIDTFVNELVLQEGLLPESEYLHLQPVLS